MLENTEDLTTRNYCLNKLPFIVFFNTCSGPLYKDFVTKHVCFMLHSKLNVSLYP